jgi:hypothetical protein
MLKYLSSPSAVDDFSTLKPAKSLFVDRNSYDKECIDMKVGRPDYLANLPFIIAGFNNKGKSSGRKSSGIRTSRQKWPGTDGTTYSILSQAPPHTTIPRGIDNANYSIVQMQPQQTFFTTSTTVTTFGATYFVVNNVDQITQLAAIFDQYRVDMIEVWMENFNQETTNSQIISVIDYDDANSLATWGQANDYQNAVVTAAGIGHYRRFVPHVAIASYSGSFASFTNVAAPWIDCSSLTVQHYGVKAAAQASSVVSTITIRPRFHLSFRNVR